ncbi:MAG: MBL fold metallo-hydrolase [Clostridia bacterium]|nr:MBL fold metallo-hydrolase [Clostridia bacterium]
MHRFTVREHLPGVYHIKDAMGVCMTLLTGSERSLLIDAGYGLEDVSAFVRTLTDKPVQLLLTHGHHDHALGARWFDTALMLRDEVTVYATYTQAHWRSRVAEQAADKGLTVPENWMDADMASPCPIDAESIALGGMTAQIIAVPGHTPGSAVVYVPERSLLLTGDDWNPTTWLFFPESVGVGVYRAHMSALTSLPFRHVLCPHQEALFPRRALEDFLAGLTDEALRQARPVDMGWALDTREAHPAPGQQFVFDYAKAREVLS